MALNFSQALMEAKRRAQLSGRPLSRQEASGIAEGYANTASERLARAKTVALQEEQNRTNLLAVQQQNEQAAVNAQLAQDALDAKTAKDAADAKLAQDAFDAKTAKDAADAKLAQEAFDAKLAQDAADFAQRQFETNAQMAAAEKAAKLAATGQKITAGVGGAVAGGAAGGAIGGMISGAEAGSVAGPWGTAIGAAVGLVAGLVGANNSYLCTETNKQAGLNKTSVQFLNTFKEYAEKNHKGVLDFYLRVGPRIVKAIEKNKGEETKQFYDDLKDKMVGPVIELTRSGNLELAFQLYQEMTLDLIFTFTPELFKEAETVIKSDEGLKEAA